MLVCKQISRQVYRVSQSESGCDSVRTRDSWRLAVFFLANFRACMAYGKEKEDGLSLATCRYRRAGAEAIVADAHTPTAAVTATGKTDDADTTV